MIKRGCRRPSKGDPDGLGSRTEDRDRDVYGFMIQGRCWAVLDIAADMYKSSLSGLLARTLAEAVH